MDVAAPTSLLAPWRVLLVAGVTAASGLGRAVALMLGTEAEVGSVEGDGLPAAGTAPPVPVGVSPLDGSSIVGPGGLI